MKRNQFDPIEMIPIESYEGSRVVVPQLQNFDSWTSLLGWLQHVAKDWNTTRVYALQDDSGHWVMMVAPDGIMHMWKVDVEE